MTTKGIYVASRTDRAPQWRELRDKLLVPIVSTWIDEAGEGETKSLPELWLRIQREIESCSGTLFYADVNDAPWKGALVEAGMAIALGKPIAVVLIGSLEGRTSRPLGSWISHPRVQMFGTVGDAVRYLMPPVMQATPMWSHWCAMMGKHIETPQGQRCQYCRQ